MTIEEQLNELIIAVRVLAVVAATCGTAYMIRWWCER